MSVTLKARAGSSFRANIKYYTDDKKTQLVNTTGYTARLQVRAHQPHSKILLDTDDPSNISQVTTNVGEWEIFLGKTFVNSLPPSVRFEVELTSDTNPEDSEIVENGVILLTPEIVR